MALFKSSPMVLTCQWCKICVLLLLVLLQTGLEQCQSLDGSTAAVWNTTCPDQCACELRRPLVATTETEPLQETANCAKQKLRSIPMDLPINTQTLLLQGNAIRSLHEHLPQFMGLKEMDLANNRITSLGPYPIFQNLTSLRRLNMENNAMEALLHGSFSGLADLEDLLLGHNQIEKIQDHAFGGLNHLKMLGLNGNKLTELRSEWFENLGTLTNLTLAENQVKVIDGPVFEKLGSLKVLCLRGNKLKSLSNQAFSGLEQLEELDLQGNDFSRVPTDALQDFNLLRLLTLDDNPIKLVSKRAFQSFSVEEISLCNMEKLLAVDAGAFYDLPELRVLQLHNNPKLSYIDPGAFVQTQGLSIIHVQSNNMRALPYTWPLILPKLKEVSFYENPLHCDCNVHWVKEILTAEANFTNSSFIQFTNSDKFVCKTPRELQGKKLKNLSLSKFPAECSPTVISFFEDSYQIQLGDSLTYECRAIGVPAPHIHWILPTGKILNGTSNFSRIRLDNVGTLTLDHLKASDAGKYTCVATNLGGQGYDAATSVLKIHNRNIHVIHKGVATNFITVTWNGTGSTIATSDYVLMYKQKGLREDYHKIDLRPYMRTYTITNLKPHTLYEFCMAYKHDNQVQKLNCINIQTKHQMFVMTGIRSMGNLSILIAVVITCSFICFLCAATMVIRRYRKRKPYKEPEGANVPEKVGNLSQIPLDNIYHPPSTPLCTSRTSLIGQNSSA